MINYRHPGLMSYLKFTFPRDTVSFWLEKINPMWSLSVKKSIFLKKLPEAKNTFTLFFKVHPKTLLPKAGQHMNISTEVNGRLLTRSYSPTIIDRDNRIIGVTIKTVENGLVSTWLNHSLRAEETVIISDPYGDFTWQKTQEPMILLAAGSGITPIISLLRTYINLNQPIQLHYWSKTRQEACFIEELKSLQSTHPNFTFHLHLTQEAAEHKYERQGRISKYFEQHIPNLASSHVLACGSNAFVTEAKRLLTDRSKTFLSESFSPPTIISKEEGGEAEYHTLTLAKQNKTISVPSNQPILEALLAEGIKHPYGCKMGICLSCACHKLTGKTKSALSNETSAEENPALKICTEYAKGDIILDV